MEDVGSGWCALWHRGHWSREGWGVADCSSLGCPGASGGQAESWWVPFTEAQGLGRQPSLTLGSALAPPASTDHPAPSGAPGSAGQSGRADPGSGRAGVRAPGPGQECLPAAAAEGSWWLGEAWGRVGGAWGWEGCRVPPLLAGLLPCCHTRSFLSLCRFGFAGEGEADDAGEKILLTHGRQAFPEDPVDPQRGSGGVSPALGPRGLPGRFWSNVALSP